MKPNVIIDGKNLAYRMFSTLNLHNSAGENVSAIFGVIKNIQSLVHTFKPRRVIVCWDTSTSALWRRNIYPEYKMNRKKSREGDEEKQAMMEDFEAQLDILQMALSWLPIYQLVDDDLEADDTMYLLTSTVLSRETNIIVSTDKDLLQAITPNTSIWSPIKEIMIVDSANLEKYKDKKSVTFEEYMGFPFEHFIDFKVLQGDTSDGIAGIKGIGEKTAIQLLGKYGSIDAMFENAEEMRKSKRNALIVEDEELIQNLRSIVDLTKSKEHVSDLGTKFKNAVIQPTEDYKNFLNFLKDNDFRSIYMDYRLWSKSFQEMGLKPISFKRRKRVPRRK